MSVVLVDPDQRLRIAVLGDFDGPHARSWLRWFVDRGHEVHAISFYSPGTPIEGATVHSLRRRSHPRVVQRPASSIEGPSRSRLPRGLVRVAQAARYQRAGLRRVLREIAPDVFHAHFLVEHGFYGAMAGHHPYVVTAWGSDVLVEPERDLVSKLIAKWTMRRADLLTSNNRYMARRMVALGAAESKVEVVTLGADAYFLEEREESVNLRAPTPGASPCIISTRAHEPLYNVTEIIDAYDQVVRAVPDARLVIAHGGLQTAALQARPRDRGGRVEFTGFLDRAAFRRALSDAAVFVAVPSSDGTSVALLQAMAAGCFPIVSDLPTQHELVEDGVNGLLVPLHRPDLLADGIKRALADPDLRRRGAELNRAIVEERGLNEHEMAKMESLYLRLAEKREPKGRKTTR